jgi:hypothetical protein
MKSMLSLIAITLLTATHARASDDKMLYFASLDVGGDFCKNPEYFNAKCSWAELGNNMDEAKKKFKELCDTNFKSAIQAAECKCEFDDQANSNGKNGRSRPKGMKTPRFNKSAKGDVHSILLWRVDEEGSLGGFGGWIDGKPNANTGMINIDCENIDQFLPK